MQLLRIFFVYFAILCSFSATGVAQKQKLEPAPRPPMVEPHKENPGITEQAGIGSTQAYARAGVLELGGSAGFTLAEDLKEVSFSPSFGWFIVDNLQLSAIVNWTYVKAGDAGGAHVLSLIAEPSFHYPWSYTQFLFAGLGVGLQFMSEPKSESGVAIAPRVGVKCLVGRSGMISLALSPVFTFNDTIQTSRGTVLAVEDLWSLNAGYSVLW